MWNPVVATRVASHGQGPIVCAIFCLLGKIWMIAIKISWPIKLHLQFIFLFCLKLLFWLSKHLRENAREGKWKGKVEEKKIWRKIKDRFKVNKTLLCIVSNLFYLFYPL